MFHTKKDVDRHVRNSFAKLKENEKNIRGFTIAKLYFKVGEYASARQYLYLFLSVQEDNASAHKLLGQCYEKLEKPDKAIACYQRSLQLDPKQPDVITNVCNLLLTDEMNLNPSKMKTILELAESEKIQNDSVLNLKIKLLNRDNVEPNQMNDVIMKEIIARPNLVSLRVRLLKNFIDQNRIDEAFKYIYDLEMKNNETFSKSIEWYNIMARVLNIYKTFPEITNPRNWEFWLLSILTIEKQIYLNLISESNVTFSQNSNFTEITSLLFEFDQLLQTASTVVFNLCTDRELAAQFILHYSGQLCLHTATVIFAKEKIFNKNEWKETIKHAIPLLMLAYQSGIADPQEGWLKHTNETTRQLIQLFNRQGAFRCAQAGRTIKSCIAEIKGDLALETVLNICSNKGIIYKSSDDLIEQTRKYCSDIDWRKSIYRKLFVHDQVSKINSSYFVTSKGFIEPSYILPTEADLENYEEVAQSLNQSSLQHFVYLGLGMKNLYDLKCQPFSGLNFSTPNLSNCNPGTLNQLDIETFLYGTILQSRRLLEIEKYNYEQYNSHAFPIILPFANIANKLCTDEQGDWWEAAYKVSRNMSVDNFGKLRMILQHGIETVRGVSSPKMNIYIALELGYILSIRAQNCMKPTQKELLEKRVETLYKHGLRLIKLKSRGNLESSNFFRYPDLNNDLANKINIIAERAVAFLAKKYFVSEEYEECIEEFSDLRLPYASYFQAEAYKFLDKSNKTPKKSKKLYMEKAKECLHKTMEYLNDPNMDQNHPLRTIIEQERRRIIYSPDNISNGYHEDTKNDNETTNYKYDEILLKTMDIEKVIMDLVDSINSVKDEVIDIKNSDLFNIKSEIIEINRKLDDLLSKKSSIRDEDAQALENLLEEELENQALAGATSQIHSAGLSRNLLQHPLASLQNQAAIPYTNLLQQQAAQLQQSNPYNSPIYNTSYPMYIHPLLTQTPQQHMQLSATKQTPQLNWNQYTSNIQEFEDIRNMAKNVTGLQQPHMQPGFPGLAQQKLTYDLSPQEKLQPNPIVDMLQTPGLLKNLYPYSNVPVEKSPPINVVITSSDPLPTHSTVTSQPLLSVTIPPQHIKNSNVNITDNTNYYQLPMSTTTTTATTSNYPISLTTSVADVPKDVVVTPAAQSVQVKFDENDSPLFSSTATLYKHINGEWKDPSEGILKILKNSATKKYHVSLFKDQLVVYEQLINADMKVNKAKSNPNVSNWSVPCIVDGQNKITKYCAKFSNANVVAEYVNAFNNAKNINNGKENILKSNEPVKTTSSFSFGTTTISSVANTIAVTSSTNTFTGFTFKPTFATKSDVNTNQTSTSTPFSFSNKPIQTTTVTTTIAISTITSSTGNTIGGFSFNSKPAPTTTTSSTGTASTNNTLGGFTFTTTTPIVTNPVTVDQKKEKEKTPPKSNYFSNFSFGMQSTDKSEKPFSNMFNLSTINQSSPLVKKDELQTKNTDETVTLNKSTELADEDDYVPTAQFQPVIPLPNLVEVKTGEENEIIAFEHRAKLLRYDPETKEWKERGIGPMKILVNPNDPNKVRLLMRREQVLKLCCNQMLQKDTKFSYSHKSETAVTWCGIDYSENELKDEVLAIRFKLPETCKKFLETINGIQAKMTSSAAIETNEKISENNEKQTLGFGDKFKLKQGEWNCDVCLVKNVDKETCSACGEKKPSLSKGNDEKTITSSTISTTKTTGAVGFGDQFKPKPGEWDCQACMLKNKADAIYCVACESPKDDTIPKKESKSLFTQTTNTSKFVFGIQPGAGFTFGTVQPNATSNPTSVPTNTNTTTVSSGLNFSFNNGKSDTEQKNSSFSFNTQNIFGGNKTNEEVQPPTRTSSSGFTFEPEKKFDFVFKSKSPGKAKSPNKDNNSFKQDENDSDGEVVEEEENNTHFTPVIPLPDKIEVKTGEENEKVLYCHRAKLFRFIDGEWKERGLGDVKILKHNETGKLRVVMRREQIFKICLNHVLTKDIEYKPKDEKSWNFVANDFSEGVVEIRNFCLRFKTHDIAMEFKAAVDDALGSESEITTTTTSISSSITITTTSTTSPNIPTTINVLEKKNDEDKKLIEKLKLPADFFDYKTKQACTGCCGCKSDDYSFPKFDENLNKDVKELYDSALPIDIQELDIDKLEISKEIETEKPKTEEVLNNLEIKDNKTPFIGGNIFGNRNIFPTANKPFENSLFGGTTASNAPSATFSFGAIPPPKSITTKDIENVSEEENEKAGKSTEPVSIFGGKLNNPIMPSKFSFAAAIKETETIGKNEINSTSSDSGNKFSFLPLSNSSITTPTGLTTNIFGGNPGGLGVNKLDSSNKFITEEKSSSINNPTTGLFQTNSVMTFANLAKANSNNNSNTTINSLFKSPTQISTTVNDDTNNKQMSGINFENILKSDTNVDFASLASSGNTFAKSRENSTTSGGFFGLKNNDEFKLLNTSCNAADDGKDTSGAGDDNYDPHYEPIIALPDEIVVKTGEEDEKKIFGERAKLYRYDANTKEWKERGVGELKILHHPENGTYRLLLRREQIHKLVLNHSISFDFTFKEMKGNANSYCWATMNFPEEHKQGEVENLAVKFKNTDIAKRFEDEVNKCLEQLKSKSDLEPEDD